MKVIQYDCRSFEKNVSPTSANECIQSEDAGSALYGAVGVFERALASGCSYFVALHFESGTAFYFCELDELIQIEVAFGFCTTQH